MLPHMVYAQICACFIFVTLILPNKLTENTFTFTAMTWGIVRGESKWVNCKLGMIRWPRWYEGQIGNLSRIPGLHPYSYDKWHGIFSDHRESGQPFHVPSKKQHLTQGNVPNHCPGVSFFGPEWTVSPTSPPTPFPATSGLSSKDWPGPTLLSFTGKPAVGCRVVCCYALLIHEAPGLII
jgi:hypothetical protein